MSKETDFEQVLRIESLRRQGNLNGAIQLAQRFLSQYPMNIEMHEMLGSLYGQLGLWNDALREYQEILKIDPDYPDFKGLCASMAVAHFNTGNFEKAINEFQIALEAKPNDPSSRFLLARCFFKLGRYDEAIREYTYCEPLHPEKALVYFGMGEAYYFQDKIEKAIENFQRSVEIAPDEGEIHFRLAQCYEKQGNRILANNEFQIAKELGFS